MTEIADTLFDPNEAEARAKLLLRLASHPGEPVADVELIFAVGSISVFRHALTRLTANLDLALVMGGTDIHLSGVGMARCSRSQYASAV
jgi:hypothetical protein